jgi:hypothetical protein
MIRPARLLIALALLIAYPPARLPAQSDLGLPVIHPSNLHAVARSPLYFQPWVPAGSSPRFTVAFDYANIYELSYGPLAGDYVQDLELSTVRFNATKDLSPTTFVTADLTLNTAWRGGLDGFLDWWHGVLGIEIPERELRPEHRFGHHIDLPNGERFEASPANYLGDLRIGAGLRMGPRSQVVGTITLPTTTAEGYGRRVPALGVMFTAREELHPKLMVEGTAGFGVTPRTDGSLRTYQKTAFGSVGGGFRWRFYRQASMFGTLWWHSAHYDRTNIAALDQNDFTFDFGWIFRTPGGAEWRVGMSEDPSPSGPGVDAVFKASRSW